MTETTQENKIQTYDEVKQVWVDCEHKNWIELKQDGWEFEYLEPSKEGGVVVMSREGYINQFREVAK